MATDLMSPRRRYATQKREPQLDDPGRLYGDETGMSRLGGAMTAKPSTPLAAVATKPAAGLYPPGTDPRAPGDVKASDGTITTSRKTPAQVAEIAAFDRSQGFTPAGEKPAYQQIQENRSARLAKDPYDLDYAENTTGTFGSQRTSAPVTAPAATTRPDGLAVKALGNAGALEQAGASVAPLASVAYRPTTDPAEKLPVTRYEVPAAAAPAITPSPMATPSAPLPAPTLTSATPSATNVPLPTPTPAPTATPSATPQIAPTPNGARLASGVSNASAAQFEQATAKNPLPQTPTSPVADVEDYDKKNRTQFSGF